MSSLNELFGDTVFGKDGETVDVDSLAENDLIGIYFSAHWCGPCRYFTPELAECYNSINASGKRFEIIFVSCDEDQESFDDYFGGMPWLTIGFESDKKNYLETKFQVDGIPTLVLVNKNGETMEMDGRAIVNDDKEGVNFPWGLA